MRVTLVSMFFDLNQARPVSFYLDHGRAVLTLDAPMILFCDADTRPGLEAIRGSRPTLYIEKRLADYDYYATLLPIVRRNRETRPSPDPRNTPEYFLLSVFKVYALYLASQREEFSATHYMWIDLGCAHVVRGIPDAIGPILAAPRPKIGCCSIHYRPPSELYPMTSYFTGHGKCGIAAGILTVEKPYVSRLFTLANAILYEQVTEGVGHAEEQILVYCYDQHPEWFSLYCGDYYSLATNYHTTKEDLPCVQYNFVERALAAGRRDIARLARTRLLVVVISGGDDPVYAQHKALWRSYATKTPGVDVYFVEAGEPRVTEDTAYVSGQETWDGILGKTLESFRVLHSETYPFVLRTNLSSVWNFPRLLDLLDTFPRTSLYAGFHGCHKDQIPYISGAGILMSSDVCSLLLDHEAEVQSVGLPDDVSMGAVLTAHGVSLGPRIPRVDIETPHTPIPTDGIHYRVKMVAGDSRDHEPMLVRTILSTWT
jgi:hypothetical protein